MPVTTPRFPPWSSPPRVPLPCAVCQSENQFADDITVPNPAFNHSPGNDVEAEYDRLRDLARQEAGKKSSCFDRVCATPPHPAPPRGPPPYNHNQERGKLHGIERER